MTLALVIFDLDNTLIDRDGAVRAWLSQVVPDGQVDHCLAVDAGGYGDRSGFFRTVAQAAECDEAYVRARFRAELPQHVRPASGASTLLARLAPRHQLAIGSNGSSAMQRAKLTAAGFTTTWATVAISDELSVAKPVAAFFHHLLASVGCRAEQALMIGDHPLNDIAGAQQVGMRTCWVRTPHHAAPAYADQVVDHLDQVVV
jgi:HAD superfamily hydrolase (TIGR01549 family)